MKSYEIRAEIERLKLPDREACITTEHGTTLYGRILGWLGESRIQVLERARERTRIIPVRNIVKIEEVRS